ncbi:hypothetical protein Tco_0583855 [Tanacetum coccineum]
MANLEFNDKHNMVAYLEKSEGSEGFHEIIDFLNNSHIKYALTKNPTIYVSFIKQFWRTATANTRTDGKVELTATIDRHVKTITEASLRRHLKLEDNDGVPSLPNSEIFEQLALMGYATDSDKLTFQKGNFSPQWRFLIHTILHCLSPKKTSWEQFSSNIATAIICLATNTTYNFSKMIFDAMVKNVESPHKFLIYPRFIQICLDMQKKHLQPHTRTYDAHLLTNKVFSNMKRLSKGYTRVEVLLFPNMLNAPSTSPSRITSSPSLSPEPSLLPQHTITSASFTSHPQHSQPLPTAEEHVPTPHDSPLHSVHSHGSDEGRMQQTELTDLVTKLKDRIEVLEKDLQVKKLEKQVKSGKARRRARSVLLEDEDAVQEKQSDDKVLIEEEELTELVENQGSGGKDEREVSTAGAELSTGKNGVNTASGSISTAAVSTASEIDTAAAEKAKEKGKGIMTEPEPPKKLKKRVQVQLTIDEELAKKLFKEEHARFNAEQEARAKEEQEQEKSNFEVAQELQKLLDERRKVDSINGDTVTEQLQESQPDTIKRYQAFKRKPISVAQARKNMMIYLKNMAGYKMEYFKGMSYDDIRPMFEVEYNKVQTLLKNKDVEEEKGQKVLEEFAEKTKTEQGVKEISKKTGGMRRKSLARKRTRETQDKDTSKRQKHDEEETTDYEEEELRLNLKIVPNEDDEVYYEPLSKKYPIVDFEYQLLGRIEAKDMDVYKLTRADGSSSYHGNLRMIFEQDENNEIWKNQSDWKVLSWKLHENCRVHTLFLDGTHVEINMLVEKKYPLIKELLEKMLNLHLEAEEESTMAFELLKFVKSQIEEQ